MLAGRQDFDLGYMDEHGVRPERVRAHFDSGYETTIGDMQAVQTRVTRGGDMSGGSAHRLLHGECVVVKYSLFATAWRTRRKGCVGPPSTMQNISCGG